ncbi:MAG: hypothetical protein WBB86_03890, partial [Candidatus Omnitrophota bacterium]
MENKKEPFLMGREGGTADFRRHYASFFKFISFIVIITFSWQQVVWAQGGTHLAQTNIPGIPYAAGTAQEAYANGTEKVVINIQDAHSSLSAQESIVSLLD